MLCSLHFPVQPKARTHRFGIWPAVLAALVSFGTLTMRADATEPAPAASKEPFIEKATANVMCLQPGNTVEFMCVDANGKHELRRTLGHLVEAEVVARDLDAGTLTVSVNGIVQTLPVAAGSIGFIRRRSMPGQKIRFWCQDSREGKQAIAYFMPSKPKVAAP